MRVLLSTPLISITPSPSPSLSPSHSFSITIPPSHSFSLPPSHFFSLTPSLTLSLTPSSSHSLTKTTPRPFTPVCISDQVNHKASKSGGEAKEDAWILFSSSQNPNSHLVSAPLSICMLSTIYLIAAKV
jgi:hypothetical protein